MANPFTEAKEWRHPKNRKEVIRGIRMPQGTELRDDYVFPADNGKWQRIPSGLVWITLDNSTMLLIRPIPENA